MLIPRHPASIEELIDLWRSHLGRRQESDSADISKLEGQLRHEVTTLVNAGLSNHEAFLVAIRRVGHLDARSRDFALENTDRLWKQFALVPPDPEARPTRQRANGTIAFMLAVAAAVLLKLPAVFGIGLENESFYLRNASFFVLPLLTGYFAWKRLLPARITGWLGGAFVAAAGVANLYPLKPGGHTEVLTVVHVPIALWLVVGIAHAGGRWRQVAGRMDFLRFSGELFIQYVLIALGGGVFTAFLTLLFNSIGIKPDPFIQNWLVPCGAAGAFVIASWLVDARQTVIGNLAPTLTRLFAPLFAALLVTFLGMLLFTGRGIDIERDMLIAFDLLLVIVLGLLLYSISARTPEVPRNAFDIVLVVLLISALLVDAVALWATATRITEFGLSPNRVAALGVNVILLVNLAWSAVLYVRFLKGQPFAALEKWQTNYLPVYGAWAALVVILFPPLFSYI